jgi:hypothetical protein
MVFMHQSGLGTSPANVSIEPQEERCGPRRSHQHLEGKSFIRSGLANCLLVFVVPVILDRMDQALAKLSAGFDAGDIANIERRAGVMRERIVPRATRVGEQLRGIKLKQSVHRTGCHPPGDEPDRG